MKVAIHTAVVGGGRFGFALLLLLVSGLLLPGRGEAQSIMGNLLDAQSGQPILLGYVGLLTEGGERVAGDSTRWRRDLR